MATKPSREAAATASRIIRAPRRTIYQAFLDPDALVAWLPPAGMAGQVFAFDAREGGTYRMSLTYLDPNHTVRGKSSVHTDRVRVRFLTLIPDERIVQQVEFESTDPAFAAPMTITWSMAEVPGGTEVSVRCDDAPAAIRREDHEAGFQSTLRNLAVFTESAAP
ncbi:MAG TPA: SRPBCC family protein [Rhodopila sp.]